jgi:GNAT superfamily N-acetyltransferase
VTRENVLVRPRQTSDMDGCVSLLELVHERDRYPQNWPARPREWLTPPNQVRAWVAVDRQHLLGHVALARPDESEAASVWSEALGVGTGQLLCVSLLFVSPRARGRGVGAGLLGEAESYARGCQAHPVLEVSSLDRKALALYIRHGWRQVGAVEPDWLPSGAQSLLFAAPGLPLARSDPAC